MVCQELVELVTDYLEGALPPTDAARVEAHLASCPHCTEYIRQMRATVHALGHLPAAAISAGALAVLTAHFRDWTR